MVLIWTINEKRFRLLSGAVLGLTVACLTPLCFDPHIFADYVPVLHRANAFSHGMPNLSSLVHTRVPSVVESQYALTLVSSFWAIRLFPKRKQEWDWNREGLFLILVSVASAPYSWFQDEALLLPAILSAIYACTDWGVSLAGFAVIDGAALLLVMLTVPLLTGAYLWTSVAWFLWYRWALLKIGRARQAKAVQDQAVAAWTNRESA